REGLSHGEMLLLERATNRGKRRARRTLNKIDRIDQRIHKKRARADHHEKEAKEAKDTTYIAGGHLGRRKWKTTSSPPTSTAYGGDPITAQQAEKELPEIRHRIAEETKQGNTINLYARSRRAQALAYLLIFVDAVALFVTFAKIFNVDWVSPWTIPTLLSALFATVGAGVAVKLATTVGRHLWVWRQGGHHSTATEPVPRVAVLIIYSGVLVLLSVLIGLSIFTRITREAHLVAAGSLGTILGLTVGLAGAAAPWLLVYADTYNGSILTRRMANLTHIIHHAHMRVGIHTKIEHKINATIRRMENKTRRLHERGERKANVHRQRAFHIILAARTLHSKHGYHPDVSIMPEKWAKPILPIKPIIELQPTRDLNQPRSQILSRLKRGR
ncbi:MAG: hypothetical protein JWL97_3453, partial [Gemmatimonadales bacterium]|nr:hypothetical protein [Gemmatimonadales bacterium]